MGTDVEGVIIGKTATGFIFVCVETAWNDTENVRVVVVASPHSPVKLPYTAYVGALFVFSNQVDILTLSDGEQLRIYEGMLQYDPNSW